jgi:DMSO/TMAO reductase YedYZ molybdopterin-dependent catalytic subunit
MTVEQISAPARLAEPGEGISPDELALAARNHGIPLEALRYDVTPPGLHYLLIHYDIPVIDADSFRLTIDGLVGRPCSLGLDDLRRRPATTVRVTMECAGNGRARLEPRPVSQPWLVEAVGTAEWTGVPLRDVLAEVELDPSAVELVFTGADRGVERGIEQDYQRSLTIAEATRAEMLLAYEMNGQPLPPQHGFPVRLVAPGWYGMAHVKWLRNITAVSEPFTGFQHTVAYRFRQEVDDPGTPVARMGPRALLIPPGIPDFMSRTRIVRAGDVLLEGRAWSGRAPVTRVEVSVDGGRNWGWRAEPGEHLLAVRATDAQGASQPLDQAWNRGGFANNAVHVVRTVCLPS